MAPSGIDHLVYVVPELDSGIDEVGHLLGVRPVLGGRHPDFGTHNALLSLGPTTYLEIIAPDPGLPRPERGFPFRMDHSQGPRLATWAFRTETIERDSDRARSVGVDVGSALPGSRERPDGSILSWVLSDPCAMPFGGVFPFLIGWGKSPHPAGSLPRAGELVRLIAEHPDPRPVRAALSSLGVEMNVTPSREVRLVATLLSPKGEVALF